MEKSMLIRVLRAQRTKLLNKNCENHDEFERVQEKLNEIELQLKELYNE